MSRWLDEDAINENEDDDYEDFTIAYIDSSDLTVDAHIEIITDEAPNVLNPLLNTIESIEGYEADSEQQTIKESGLVIELEPTTNNGSQDKLVTLIKGNQDQDIDIAFVITIIKENIDNKPKIAIFENQIQSALYYVNDILYKSSEEKDVRQQMKYVSPEDLIQTTIYQLHQTTMAGHLGLKRTLKRVFHRYYSPFLKETIK